MGNINPLDLDISYTFNAEVSETDTVAGIEDIATWIDFRVTGTTSYNGEEYSYTQTGNWHLDPEIFDPTSHTPPEDVNSECIFNWIGGNDEYGHGIKAIYETAAEQLADVIKNNLTQEVVNKTSFVD